MLYQVSPSDLDVLREKANHIEKFFDVNVDIESSLSTIKDTVASKIKCINGANKFDASNLGVCKPVLKQSGDIEIQVLGGCAIKGAKNKMQTSFKATLIVHNEKGYTVRVQEDTAVYSHVVFSNPSCKQTVGNNFFQFQRGIRKCNIGPPHAQRNASMQIVAAKPAKPALTRVTPPPFLSRQNAMPTPMNP